MILTIDQLQRIAPYCKQGNAAIYAPLLTIYMDKYLIDTKTRMAPFIANLAHESSSFNRTLEMASGAEYENNKMLGNTEPGDGVKFKGRGLIQITGRSMYLSCSRALFGNDSLLEDPSPLEKPDAATQSACWFWAIIKGLNQVADKPAIWTRVWDNRTFTKFQWIVLRINGGQNGIDERQAFLQRAEQIL